MPTLYLIDGYAQFFRCYHAIRTPMTSPVTKEPTNMTFAFVGMLLKLLRGQGRMGGKPEYIALALDVSGDRGTFRSQLYSEYKAQRPPPPEDLRPQVDRCLDMLRALGVPILGAEGFEADDVMATLVVRLRRERPDLRIRMISKDKDLKQLLGESVELFDIHTDTVFDERSLEGETGLKPGQVIDMLALMGDTVDNVPGVAGVGEKTAAQLLREYGSLEGVLARAGEIKGKRGENIRGAAATLALSRELVTLRLDVPIELDLRDAEASRLKLEKLGPILKELGFNRYQEDLRVLRGEGGGATESAGPKSTSVAASATAEVKPPAPRRSTGPDPMLGGLFETTVGGAPKRERRGDYRCVATRKELDALAAELRAAGAIAVDTETTSLSPRKARLCGLSFAVRPGQGWYVPVRSPTPDRHLDEATVLSVLKPILEDQARPKFGHNLKYDILVLRNAGVELRGVAKESADAVVGGAGGTAGHGQDGRGTVGHGQDGRATGGRATVGFDSMIASYLIDSARSSHGLEALSLALLDEGKSSISELIGSGKNQRSFDTVPIEDATGYAAMDADLSLRLARLMGPQLTAMKLDPLFIEVEMPLVEVLAELEWNGILVDPDELDRQRLRLTRRIEELFVEINRTAKASIGRTFDPDSPKQLSAALFNSPGDDVPGLGLKSTKKTKTGQSTDAEVLEKLTQDATITTPIPALILEYRQLTKLVSTYLVALKQEINPETKRVHSSFSQTVAATGRLASSDPNLQNIPIRTDIGREIRRAFVAPEGYSLVTADYSQIELRLLAHLSKDPALSEAFHRGEDIHLAVAAQIHGCPLDQVTRDQRSGAKMVNFGIVYGITAFGLARRLGISNTEADEIITGYKKRFAGITTFLEECVAQAKRFGYVQTMLGRRRPIADIESGNPSARALAERIAINSVVQGSAADLIKLAMIDLHRVLRAGRFPGAKMLLQIHDELVFEAPDARAEELKRVVVERMESAMTLSVPLRADAHVARNWYEGK